VLRRILSLSRKLQYRSILVEEIRSAECDLLKQENEALARRKADYQGSTVHRLTFLKCLANSAPQQHEFLGYAIFKTDHFGGNVSRAHVYESLLRPVRAVADNNFIHTQRDYDITTSAGSGSIRGVLFAQQNDLTFACAHVALRAALSCVVPEADVTYAELNRLAGVVHQDPHRQVGEGTDRGLSPAQMEVILNHYRVPYTLLKHEPSRQPLPTRIEYQTLLYASIESGRPALLGFELEAHPATGETSRHLIPVIGHTFNDDAWVPDAERSYFLRGQGYFRSEAWLSTYVVHDDNLGPYYCLPRYYLSRKSFRLLYSIQPTAASLSLAEAEALADSTLISIHRAIPMIGVVWYDRFAAYGRTGSLVLRSFQANRRQYLDHLANLQDVHGQRFP